MLDHTHVMLDHTHVMADDVSIIVPVWNGRAMVERLLSCLRAQTHRIAEILVVDNGSEDGAPEAAERLGARVIRMGSNTGFSRAVNRGIKECATDWVAIVNSDVEPEPEWLERLMEAAKPPGVWFAAGKLLSLIERDLIDGTYDALCRGACAWRVGHGRPNGPEFSSVCDIWFAPGTASLFRSELFRRVGLFDESFETYLEDVEFGLRCATLNYPGRFVPDAIAYHAGSAALGKWHPDTIRRISRNQLLLVAKHYPQGLVLRWAWPILVAQTLWGVVASRHGTFFAFLRGKLDGMARFRAMRRNHLVSADKSDRFLQILQESEGEIRRIQRLAGFDWYWRVYFALTRGGAD
jgi:GT2 family glycosyltransferase